MTFEFFFSLNIFHIKYNLYKQSNNKKKLLSIYFRFQFGEEEKYELMFTTHGDPLILCPKKALNYAK